MTNELFREDGYLQQTNATVTAVHEHGVVLDKTVFYPRSGGQAGDTGTLTTASGNTVDITDTSKDRDSGEHLHRVDNAAANVAIGDAVTVTLDWDRRHRLMRMHSCMHMLCALIDAPVTGGSIQDGRGRLDFDLADPVDKAALTTSLNQLINSNKPMSMRWISDAELDAQPELVRTMSVQPPRGSGKIRLIEFDGIDLQPCGGTHVAATGEIGPVRVSKVEKKGRQNRRVIVVFDDE